MIFLFSVSLYILWDPSEPLIQWVPWFLPVGKEPAREAGQSAPNSASIKMIGALPPFSIMYLLRRQGQLNLPK